MVIGSLCHYGKLFFFRQEREAEGIFNGVLKARIALLTPILSSISSLANLQGSSILCTLKRAESVEQRAILPPRVTRSVALTARSREIGPKIVLYHRFAESVWPLHIPLQSYPLSITVLMSPQSKSAGPPMQK